MKNKAGKRISGHFLSHITGRIHKEYFVKEDKDKIFFTDLQLAAIYISGTDPSSKRQYHIQITGRIFKNNLERAVYVSVLFKGHITL